MAIVKRNLYLPGQNLTNLAQNADYNRIGRDLSDISIAFGAPSVVTVLAGSLIECNGNLYAVTSDETFNMTAGHNYITFTDNPAPAFASAAARGTYDPAKGGYYQAGNVIRTLRWYVDQTGESFALDIDNHLCSAGQLRAPSMSRFRVYPSTLSSGNNFPVEFDTAIYDTNGELDAANYYFIPGNAGYYWVYAVISLGWVANNLWIGSISIVVNGANRAIKSLTRLASASIAGETVDIGALLYLNVDDEVKIQVGSNINTVVSTGETNATLDVIRLL